MTDPHRPFLTAVIAEPDEDKPRLVYADFLDEQGQCERTEFVRVQCELARLADAWKGRRPAKPIARWSALRRRERELLDLRRVEWVPAVIPDIGADAFGPVIAFRRGFVEVVTLSWPNWNAAAAALRAATPLREVVLTTWPEPDGRYEPETRWHVLTLPGRAREFRLSDLEMRRAQWSQIRVIAEEAVRYLLAAEWPRLTFTLPDSPFPGSAPRSPVIESRRPRV